MSAAGGTGRSIYVGLCVCIGSGPDDHENEANRSAQGPFPPCNEPTIYSLAIAAAGNHRVKGKSGNRSNS